MAADPPLTPYERRCWKRLQRQLEADEPEAARLTLFGVGVRYPARWLAGVAAELGETRGIVKKPEQLFGESFAGDFALG